MKYQGAFLAFKIFLLFVIVTSINFSCSNNTKSKKTNNTSEKETQKHDTSLPEWAKSANIYEVNLRQYTPEGTINAFAEHLPRLKNMGVDILWIMPIFPISTTKKKGSLGSYYSVNNFLEINPEFGTMEDMDQLIAEIHKLDMKIILDWVPNHTGWDNVWISEHNDWYTKDLDGNIVDPQNDEGVSHGWTDVADLNYDSKAMRAEMLSHLEWWVKEKNIDGFRMDIAFGVPDDFWDEVRNSLYRIKPIFMIAESENASHRNDSTFHSTYGWNLFHTMNDIASGKKSIGDFKTTHQENSQKFNRGGTLCFTSNHDENAWNGTVFERLGEGHKSWAVLMALLDGFPLIYGGMEEPMNKRLAFFEKDTIGFSTYEYENFYRQLFQLKKDNPALWNSPYGGKAEWLDAGNHVLAFKRTKDKNQVTVLINTSNKKVTINKDLLIGSFQLGSNEYHTPSIIEAFGYQVFINNVK